MESKKFIFKTLRIYKEIPIYKTDFHTQNKHHTRNYWAAMEIIENENIYQKQIDEALRFFFNEDRSINIQDKTSISEIHYCFKSKIIQIKAKITENIYNNRNNLAKATGWYFYVTGIDLPESDLSAKIDSIPKIFRAIDLKWELKEPINLKLKPIATGPNENAYLLTIADKNLLLDSGISYQTLNFLRDSIKLDLIFISHSHFDHTSGLLRLVELFPDIPILLSQTTLDFFLLQVGTLKRDFNNNEKKLVENAIIVKNNERIQIFNDKGYFQFFFAGHMPGALMFFANIKEFKFLYTGDYSFYDYMPIPGIYQIGNLIPRSIDFLLIDGCFSHEQFRAPSYQFNFLKDNIKFKALKNDNVLIGADPASTAIIIFITLHSLFISLKEETGFDKRPFILLNRKVYEYVKILNARLQDLHPITIKHIKTGFNPFQSAMIKWINNIQDKKDAEKVLKVKNKNGNIIIFDPADLNGDWILDFFQIIASNPNNAIYLVGPLRYDTAIELVSGTDDLTLNYSNRDVKFKNRAKVLNRVKPDNILNLHGDEFQLRRILELLKPKKVCLFQQNPQKLISVRNWILKDFPFIKETFAFYAGSTNEINLYSNSN